MIRKLIWLSLLVAGYLWVVRSGKEDLVWAKGKALYETVVDWFDDTQIEFHFKKEKAKKHSRRWD